MGASEVDVYAINSTIENIDLVYKITPSKVFFLYSFKSNIRALAPWKMYSRNMVVHLFA